MDIFRKHEKMNEIIKTSQDYFSYLKSEFVERILTIVLNEGNNSENKLSKIKQKVNRICSKLILMIANEKMRKIALTRCKKQIFQHQLFENQNNQNNKYLSMAELIFVNSSSYNNIKVIMEARRVIKRSTFD